MNGWVKVYRNIWGNEIWQNPEPFDRRSAWVDLLLMANYFDNKVMIGNKLESVCRGQKITSIRKLAKRWGWGIEKTVSFLEVLESLNMIKMDKNNRRTIITIVKYNDYQGDDFNSGELENVSRTVLAHVGQGIAGFDQTQTDTQAERVCGKVQNTSKPYGTRDFSDSAERFLGDTPNTNKNIYIPNTYISNLTDITDLDSVSNSDKINDKDNVSNLDNINNTDIDTNTNKSITNKHSVNKYSEEVKQIIEYLNQKTGKKFRPESKSTKEKVISRLKEGYTVADFQKVIDNKVESWGNDAKMCDYLRPETLFAPSHFESYLNEKRKEKVTDADGWKF